MSLSPTTIHQYIDPINTERLVDYASLLVLGIKISLFHYRSVPTASNTSQTSLYIYLGNIYKSMCETRSLWLQSSSNLVMATVVLLLPTTVE